MKLDILAFGAHPDDVELSCAGTILRNVALGKKVGIIDLTRGELGTRGTAAIREKEAKAAAKIMGVEFRENLKMPDGFFEVNKKNLLKVIQKIRQYKPDVVLATALEDRHPDHERAAKLIADACFLSGLVKIKTTTPTLKGEKTKNSFRDLRQAGAWQLTWRPQAVYHYIQYRKLKADFAVDITRFMETKMKAISSYASQFYNPHSKEPATLISQKDFFDYVRTREKEYGKLAGAEYAEGYNVMEEYRGTIFI